MMTGSLRAKYLYRAIGLFTQDYNQTVPGHFTALNLYREVIPNVAPTSVFPGTYFLLLQSISSTKYRICPDFPPSHRMRRLQFGLDKLT